MKEKKIRLLLVDDEENILHALYRTLRKEPYEIEIANSAKEAAEKFYEKPFDIVISDYKMPGVNGLEFLKWVRENFPDTIRIVLTGQADMDVAIEAINEGEIYRFFTKPWDDDEIKLALRIAAQSLELERENRRLLEELKKTKKVIEKLEEQYPGITQVERDEEGRIILNQEEKEDEES